MAVPEPVEGQPVRPPRPGTSSALMVVAPTIDAQLHWLDGVTWSPEGCGQAGAALVECAGNTDELEPGVNAETQIAQAVYLWSAEICSTLSFRSRDWLGRVRRSLEADESFLLAAELERGELIQADGGPTLTLVGNTVDDTDPEIITTGEQPIRVAFSDLDGALTRCMRNSQGMVHVTPEAFVELQAQRLVWLNGTTWLTPNGHLVVADGGYEGAPPDGTAPEAGTEWMYGTDLIWLRKGPIATVPQSLESMADVAQVMDRATNDITVWAGRFALWQWDGCCHLAAQVNSDPFTI